MYFPKYFRIVVVSSIVQRQPTKNVTKQCLISGISLIELLNLKPKFDIRHMLRFYVYVDKLLKYFTPIQSLLGRVKKTKFFIRQRSLNHK